MAILKKSKPNKKEVTVEENLQKEDIIKQVGTHLNPNFLIKQSWITEKAVSGNVFRQYSFIVSIKANKSEIRKAIQSLYKVKVQDVNIINVKGKSKRLGRSMGRTSGYKKATVTLKEGEKIEALTT